MYSTWLRHLQAGGRAQPHNKNTNSRERETEGMLLEGNGDHMCVCKKEESKKNTDIHIIIVYSTMLEVVVVV